MVGMVKQILRSDDSIDALVLRVFLGAIMFPHGAQKLLGWYGGFGFEGTVQFFTASMSIPWLLAVGVILAESLGAVALMIGLLTRVAAFGIFCVMTGAIWMVHWPHGFFMNWFGKQAGEGFEYHLLAIAIALALMVRGGGACSLDGALSRRAE